ncbi:hypothetical protein MFIFM68171_11014 [Madurella fahalii]|uniref:Uncharacterized protein n=1 Tax=Madurella fahalii TaxID=1157608 RepID=A0ABQ0GSU8_9PEZI
MATRGTLSSLPPQPLPKGDLVDSVFVTIWWFSSACFALILSWQLRTPYAGAPLNWLFPRRRATWDIFRSICLATGILAFWYFFLMIDRWIRFDQRASVAYSYIVFVTLIESLRVLSAIIFAWGNYKVVWVEVETRFDEIWQGRLWTAAKLALFVVSLVSIFYAVLYVALAGAWLDFLSLNSIADIATKRTSFEVATAALLTVFALLAFGSAYYAVRYQSRKVDGKGNNALKNRWLILAATLLFFMRSLIEFALLLRVLHPEATRGSLTLARDVSYGLLSFFYLLAITSYASKVSSPDDMGRADTQDIRANVRRYIDDKLSRETEGERKEARPFLDIMEEIEEAFENNTDGLRARFYAGSTLSDEVNKKTIEQYFVMLRSNYGHLGSDDPEPAVASPYQSTTSLLSTIGNRILGAASDPDMRGTFRGMWNRSLLDVFQGSGRQSAPPTTPGRHDAHDEERTANIGRFDPFDTATISEWTRTEYISRRGSVARSHRNSSAPSRPLATHMESQFEMGAVNGFGRTRDSRIVTDPTALSSVQGRWELAATEPPSPRELGPEQARRPGYPPYQDRSPPRMRRQRESMASYRDQRPDGGFEPEQPYRPYHPQATAAPSNNGPINPYAVTRRSLRRQRTPVETGLPATPYLQQATPRVPVNRHYTATPEQTHYEQGLSIPGVPPTSQPDNPPSQAVSPPTPPATEPDVSGPLLPAATNTGQPGSRPPQMTMRFQVGARNRRAAARQASSSQGVES